MAIRTLLTAILWMTDWWSVSDSITGSIYSGCIFNVVCCRHIPYTSFPNEKCQPHVFRHELT